MKKDLKQVETHFKFGENWKEYSKLINEDRITEAEKSLLKLVGSGTLKGKAFLDIGCGSGLFSLAALRLGAKKVLAVDIDPDSVKTTRTILMSQAPRKQFDCKVVSVFDLDPKEQETYDIVYSWGVLHHTGDMYQAIKKASQMVSKGGLLVIALYKKTPCCGFWKWEKRFYSKAPRFVQKIIQSVYILALSLRFLMLGQNPIKYIQEYTTTNKRGMSFFHDVHDWLGGYPYESISTKEMQIYAEKIGYQVVKEFLLPKAYGLFGSGCEEYVLRRT